MSRKREAETGRIYSSVIDPFEIGWELLSFMKTISPLCENGERGLRAFYCTRPPTIGSEQREEEDRQKAEGGGASLLLASFRERGSGHLLVGISKGVREKS